MSALLALVAQPAMAANFNVTGPDSVAKTLGTGSGQTGTVSSTGVLTVSGSTVAVTISGSNATLTNTGTINQTGTGRAIRDNTGVTGLTVTNNAGALMQTADADVIQMNVSPASVTLNNSGTMTSLNATKGGAQAVDFNAIQSGANIINNSATGILQARDADSVRPGVNGVVTNDGIIKSTITTDTGSDGIDAQANSGISITNASTNNAADPNLIEGARHGITGGGGSGSSVVNITMSITNKSNGTISGKDGAGINIDGFSGAESVTVINNGLISGNGLSRDGDGIDVDGLINLTNTGTIKSLNSSGVETSEGVTVGGGTIVNSGTIEGDVAAGNTTAIGRGITLAGVDKNSSGAAIPQQGIYANSSITNSGLIRGQSDSGIAVGGPASGFTVTIDNLAGGVIRGAGASAATIQSGADKDTITNAGSIINDGGDSKTAISLGAGDDQLTVTGGSAVITGGIDGGSGGETAGDKLTFNLGAAANTFTHSGVISNFEKMEVSSGKVTLNGNNTYAGTTKVGGGAFAASLRVNGRHAGGGDYTVLSGNKLGGTGTFALATAGTKIDIQNGATLQIGGGRLTVETGSLNVDGLFSFDLNGTTAGTAGGYDQLMFSLGNTGTITLGGSSALQLNLGFSPVLGQQFELIDVVNGGTFINGAFAGLTDGAFFTQGGQQFQISYFGGTGNDLVVTAIPEPSTTAAILSLLAFSCVAVHRAKKRKTAVHAGSV